MVVLWSGPKVPEIDSENSRYVHGRVCSFSPSRGMREARVHGVTRAAEEFLVAAFRELPPADIRSAREREGGGERNGGFAASE